MKEEKKCREVDIVELIKKILKEWKLLLSFCGIAGVIGIIVALSAPKTYTAQAILAPELSSGGLGVSSSIADMASNFGIDIGKKSSMDAIYPEIYPEIFASTDFLLSLFNTPIRTKSDNRVRNYTEYLSKETSLPFWLYPKLWINGMLESREVVSASKGNSDPMKISKTENELCVNIEKSIMCVVDKKTSEITISFTDQDPLVAAIMVDTLQSRLQAYITDYRTKKARVDLEYYKRMTDEYKKKYEKAQKDYASYSDSHFDTNLSSFAMKRDQLENEMQLQYNMYTQMAAQMNQAIARVQERTPAFSIIQRPLMPHRASSRPRSTTVLLFMFLGGVIDVLWVGFGRELFSSLKGRRTIEE